MTKNSVRWQREVLACVASMFSTSSLLCQFGADQVARVCETLEQSGDVERLARFLWSLPSDAHVRTELDRHESIVRARALVAYHAGNFADLFRLLETFRFTQVPICLRPTACTVLMDFTSRTTNYSKLERSSLEHS